MPSAFLDFIKNITKKKEKEKENKDFNELFEFCRNKNSKQRPDDIRAMIDKDVSIVDTEDPSTGMTPIMVASKSANYYALQMLLFKQDSSDPNKHGEIYQRFPIKAYKTNLEGLNAYELAGDYRTKDFLKNYYERHYRFKDTTIEKGWHETGLESFNYIFNDHTKGLYPFFGGNGGYFGGGVYFALSQQESSIKALHHGYGFQCKIIMGTVYHISDQSELNKFIEIFCRNQNSYELPNDVMRWRLQYFGDKPYDSVWGHKGAPLPLVYPPPLDNRILKTGDEIVAYYPDQISIVETYITNINNKNSPWIPQLKGFKLIPSTLFDNILYKTSADSVGYLDYNNDGTLLRRLERNVDDQTDEIKIYDTRNKYIEKEIIKVLTYEEQVRNYVTHFAFHPINPDIYVVVLNKKRIRLYTSDNETPFIVMKNEFVNITSIHFHPTEPFLFAISYDKSIIYCWDLGGNLVKEYNLDQPLISQFIFNKKGTYLASKNSSKIKIWKIEPLEFTLIAEFNKGFMGGEYMSDMEFYKENNLIINVGSYILIWKDFINNTNVTWDTTSVNSNKISKFTGGVQHDKKITSISVHEESGILLSGSLDKTIKYWDINNLKCIKTTAVGIPVKQVLFNPNPTYENEHVFCLENLLCYIGPSTLTSGGKRKSLKRVKRTTTIAMK